MNMIRASVRPTIAMLTLMTLLFGVAYPFVTTVAVQKMFPEQTQASLIKGKNGDILGSELIGQNFTEPQYFWGRLSATSDVPYNASASSGYNLGSASPVLLSNVQARIDLLKSVDPDNTKPIPVDLVTASASGLDPDISVAAAEYQIARVAKARSLDEAKVRDIVARFTSPKQFGILGEERVNLLKVNLALDDKI